MSIPQSIILGIIQGITEWLPISSSGHLVIAQEFFELQNTMIFDIMLHIATVVVVVIVFWRDIKKIVISVLKRDFHSEHGKLAIYIIIGSIPTGIIGFLFCDTFEKMFSNLWAVAGALMITGILLLMTKGKPYPFLKSVIPSGEKRSRGISLLRKSFILEKEIPPFSCSKCGLGQDDKQEQGLNKKTSFLIGIFQGIAIIPGISRSGATISTGILAGIDRMKAARFSFLLSIPAILGALLLELGKLKNLTTNGINFVPILTGMAIATIVGYFSLKILLKIINLEKFYIFGYYCVILSIILFSILISIK